MTDSLKDFDLIEIINQLPVFKVGCSSIGKIMTESRGKSTKDKIQDTAIKIEEQAGKLLNVKEGSKAKEGILSRINNLNDFTIST